MDPAEDAGEAKEEGQDEERDAPYRFLKGYSHSYGEAGSSGIAWEGGIPRLVEEEVYLVCVKGARAKVEEVYAF